MSRFGKNKPEYAGLWSAAFYHESTLEDLVRTNNCDKAIKIIRNESGEIIDVELIHDLPKGPYN